ncbi:MAG: sugar phosphate isomerase/epimerase family protein [Clostridia bacterium]|nr:sugar phosphate isomerase/epimerase family protein [Clostridia bacterium]
MLENTIISGFADEISDDIKEQVALLKELDVKYIEFRSANSKGVSDYSNEDAEKMSAYLKENGIGISALGSPIGKIKITDDFEPHFEKFKHTVELIEIFGTKYIRMFSFYIPEGEEPEKYRDEVFRRMKMMVDYAKEKNVVLLHENEKGIYGDNAKRCRELFDELYCDNFRCTFDFANFIQCGQDTLEAYDLLKDFIAYIHIKDARFSDSVVVPAGEGDGNVKAILSKLDEKGFDGFLSLEPHLADFATFKTLEHTDASLKDKGGVWAYSTAHAALMKLLK